jgi:protein O-GlcNAc transferase
MSTDTARQLFMDGLTHLDRGDFVNAERFFTDALRYVPRNISTLSNLAFTQFKQDKFADAALTARTLLEIDRKNAGAYEILSSCQLMQGDYNTALSSCKKLIEVNATSAIAHSNLAYVLSKLQRYREALDSSDRALAIDPRFADAYVNRGNALSNLDRADEALFSYEKALSINPNLANAWLGRGNALTDLKRYGEALPAFDKALSIIPDLAEAWLGRGNAFADLKRRDEALAAYEKALSIKANLVEAWLGRGNVFLDLKNHDEAMTACERALSLRPESAEAWLGRGNIFAVTMRCQEALAAYDKALAIKPNLAEAWAGRGNMLVELKRHVEALAAYDRALASKPNLLGVQGARLKIKAHLCDWENMADEIARLSASIRAGKTNPLPFALLLLSESPEDQLLCAESWVSSVCPPAKDPARMTRRHEHGKIRVGYVSTDFYGHAISYLIAEALELHDGNRVEITGISIGRDDNTEIRRRLVRAFDRFLDCRLLSDNDVVRAIRDAEIDILIDLNGFTSNARTGIFAMRAAPVQVNYLGYPGTMGAPYMDYIIGDKVIFRKSDERYYSEKLVRLPFCYQPNDRRREISTRRLSREDAGLPRDGIVFCCFNNSSKILPDVFQCWMRILQRVNGSVLWLLVEDPTARSNLEMQASSCGLGAGRLVFARMTDTSEHLARHRLADLFLDTVPYNAHTTGSDALWAGLPVLTRIGTTFAGRVAASLLEAVGVPDLITHSREEYEELAIELALDRKKLKRVKDKLEKHRSTAPLFDTPLFVRHLEAAYVAMHERYRAGLPADHIEVQPLRPFL